MNRAWAMIGGALLAVAGCGSDGDGGGGGPQPPAGPAATGTINSNTVLVVTGRSVSAVFESGGFGDITDFVGLTSVASGNPGSVRTGNAAKPVADYVTYNVPVGPETTLCEEGGAVTVSGDITNPLTVTPGDFLDYEWENCDDGLGQVIDGEIGLTFTDFEGSLLAGQVRLVVSLDISNFQILEDGVLNTANGDLTLTIDSLDQPTTVITTLGNTLAITGAISSDSLSDFTTVVTEDGSIFPSHFTTDATGAVNSTLFGGFVTYDTPVEFDSIGDAFPYTGELLVFGSDNSNIRIIALSDSDIRIEADYDGDRSRDATIDTTWEALLGD